MNRLISIPGNAFTGALQKLGYERRRRPFSDFIEFKGTLKSAAEAGLSVGDFIERKHTVGGKTLSAVTMEKLSAVGIFESAIERVCELGPGSGRYLGKTIERCNPREYEIYETSMEWRGWLVKEYKVLARQTNGIALSETNTASVDLVQAHRLFPGLPLLVTLSYFKEMARVVRDGGWIVFDIMTENCFSSENLKQWLDANPWNWDWAPHMIGRDYVIKMFSDSGLTLVSSFEIPHFPAVTECFVFRK